MSSVANAGLRMEPINLAANAAISADGSTATPMDTTLYEGTAVFALTAVAGGTGALDTFFEESDASASGYTDIPSTRVLKSDGTTANFSQITTAAVAEGRGLNMNECKKFVRIRNDVTGSTSITRAVIGFAQKKYQTA